ncbi:MAG: trypsin-like peptidase domain-containing protein [Clostridia bacterium]|nr:trypsin-like peptidase domain-containing protein [Clostridia bacterium]
MKRLTIILIIIMLVIPSMSFAESKEVTAFIVNYDVTVNGEKILTEESQYPVLNYKNITYFPMTYDYLKGTGLKVDWSSETGLHIYQIDSDNTFEQSFLGGKNVLGSNVTATIATYPIQVNDEIINNAQEEYPVITYKSITYFPMTWRYAVDNFNWKTSWSSETGFMINAVKESTTQNIPTEKEALTREAVKQLSDAVVKLEVDLNDDSSATGSGFFLDAKGTLITNHHVVEDAKSIKVQYDDGSYYSGEVHLLGFNKTLDLALLDLDVEDVPFLEVGEGSSYKEGDLVYAIGSPLGVLNVFSEGEISVIRSNDIEITAPIDHGSSGGALFNTFGEVIGITSAVSEDDSKVGFAIRIEKLAFVEIQNDLTISSLAATSDQRLSYVNGDIYVGSVKEDMKDGYGEYYYDDGNIYKGEWQEDVKSGYGEFSWTDGTLYQGQWDQDDMNGFGIKTFISGTSYEGDFLNGEFHGKGTFKVVGGDLYVGDFQHDEMSGYGIYTWAEGDHYEGNWLEDQKNGYGVYTWADGGSYEGNWLMDQMNGQGVYTWSDGSSYEGNWLNDQRDGEGVYTDTDGTKHTEIWENGEFRESSYLEAYDVVMNFYHLFELKMK